MNRVDHDGIRWELLPEFATLFPVVLATPGRTVKESAAKLVTVHTFGGKEYFIKRYRLATSPLRSFAYHFRRSPAREEWELSQQLATRNVPIVRHLAFGEHRDWRGLRESVLITEGFPSETLSDLLWRKQTPPSAAILALVQHMHSVGLLQHDLHPGNILVGRDGGGLRLVDLDGAILKPALTQTERDDNLAFLGIYLDLPVSAEVRARTQTKRRTTIAIRSQRCFRENRSFGQKTFGGRRWMVRHSLITPAIEKILAAPDEFLAGAKVLKAGRSSTVGAGSGVVLKRYNLRRWFAPFKNLFRASRARKGFQRAYHLELLWIPTARPVAASDERVLGFPVRSFFLMEEIPDACALQFWHGDKRAAARAVAQLLGQLHHEGFAHRDLKDSNLIFDRTGQPHLIDLDGLNFLGHPPTDLTAATGLARLVADAGRWRQKLSRSDRARFLVHYCRARERTDWRWWWREIAKQS